MENIAMAMTETQLKECIKNGGANLYVFYGAESYLTEQYARMVARETVEEGFDAFNLQRFDGQEVTAAELEDAVEALPLMTDRKCVMVRDYDVSGSEGERVLQLMEQVPDSCVLVFWQMTVTPDKRKNAWKEFIKIAQEKGVLMHFERKDVSDTSKMLAAGAKRRGCLLDVADARYLVEQVGNDLNLLIHELDKLCALAGEQGTVTRGMIDAACPKNLEAKVFDLSKAILYRRSQQAFDLLHQLRVQREEPIAVLGVLSNAFSDLYRGKVASAAGMPPEALARAFKSYKNKEFRLKNGARDSARISVDALRRCLEVLAETDVTLKLRSSDEWVLLEQTVARLMEALR